MQIHARTSPQWEHGNHTRSGNEIFPTLRRHQPGRAGVDTETIMKIVGHSSVEMFLRYRTIKSERLDSAMARLDAAITTPAITANHDSLLISD
jgi:hypothetical protein